MDLLHELEVAVAAVRSAATVCRAVQADLVSAATLEKKDKSPVTVADFASQALVSAVLEERSSLRAIVGDALGLHLICRRFEGGRLRDIAAFARDPHATEISTAELSLLLEGASSSTR